MRCLSHCSALTLTKAIDAYFQDLRELATRRETELKAEVQRIQLRHCAHLRQLEAEDLKVQYEELAHNVSEWMIDVSHQIPLLISARTVDEAEVCLFSCSGGGGLWMTAKPSTVYGDY